MLLTSPAVVAELDDVVLIAVPLGVHDETEESLLLLLLIYHHPPPEKPVTTVLAVNSPSVSERQNPNANPRDPNATTPQTTVPARLTCWTEPGRNIPHWLGFF